MLVPNSNADARLCVLIWMMELLIIDIKESALTITGMVFLYNTAMQLLGDKDTQDL